MKKISLLVLITILFAGCIQQETTSTTSTSSTIIPQTTSTTILEAASVSGQTVAVYFIDVGQGDAALIDTSDKDVVIDAGSRSAGKETVVPLLKSINATTIHFLLASNHDEDHMGGLIAVLDSFNVSTVLDSGSTKETMVFQDFISRARQKNFTVIARGQEIVLDNITKITVLNPLQPLEFEKENDNSIVLRITVQNISFLFAGDCEKPCEESILKSGLAIESVFLKVGHHGSKTSSSEAFLKLVQPRIALIGVGSNNRYGHPHNQTLKNLAEVGASILRTDLHGTIKIALNRTHYAIEYEKNK